MLKELQEMADAQHEAFFNTVRYYKTNTTPEQAEADGKFVEELCGMQSKSLLDSLMEYMENRTPEQAMEDEELMRKWEGVGPTVDEYLEMVGFKEKKEGEGHE